MNIAWLDWSLNIECPNCKEEFDLSRNDDDHTFSSAVFSNNWDSLRGEEVTCPGCMHEFKLDSVEY